MNMTTSKSRNTKKTSDDILPSIPSWTDLMGFRMTLKRLTHLWITDKLPSVLLFEGRDGIGKRSIAAAAAAMPFCSHHEPCGICANCHAVLSTSHPEILWVETSDISLKLTDADRIHEHLSVHAGSFWTEQNPSNSFGSTPSKDGVASPQRAVRIVVIIDADKLNQQAANRLLVTLEEPPLSSHIFMTTSRPKAMLPTVLSRAIKWHLAPPHLEDTLTFLKTRLPSILSPETPTPTDTELKECILRAGLSPGKALDLCGHEGMVGEKIRRLLNPENMLHILEAAEELGKSGTTFGKWIEMVEVRLNERYKKAVSERKNGTKCPSGLHIGVINERRRMLSQVKRAAVNQKIALNMQLASESLGFSGISQ